MYSLSSEYMKVVSDNQQACKVFDSSMDLMVFLLKFAPTVIKKHVRVSVNFFLNRSKVGGFDWKTEQKRKHLFARTLLT